MIKIHDRSLSFTPRNFSYFQSSDNSYYWLKPKILIRDYGDIRVMNYIMIFKSSEINLMIQFKNFQDKVY